MYSPGRISRLRPWRRATGNVRTPTCSPNRNKSHTRALSGFAYRAIGAGRAPGWVAVLMLPSVDGDVLAPAGSQMVPVGAQPGFEDEHVPERETRRAAAGRSRELPENAFRSDPPVRGQLRRPQGGC